ncbi:MAG: 16S rRNA (adenine(1518)-N(6)/adenine(1519)-N(6))-dimethyltransferase RsmA [Bacteroidales bacterium]|jgi:16S rRNA (adenine1518-N6/adenine1519-N6)-dimethyltransferase|nr:16S rRNA (adenine(1518)-N(6)/adenine(1519)-N(6))-dimethyltransferase RsmA [Bacteroidales bacterium]
MVKAKKHLGQHFLRDEGVARSIVEGLTSTDMPILEIGPGTGVLTKYLIERPDFYAAEVDTESVEFLRENYPQLSGKLLEGDVIKMDLSHYFDGKFSIIGNLPYNISSQIFFKVLENKDQVDEVVCMIQREVAQRIAEPPGTKTYGILSVLLQAYYDIEYLFTVHEHVFVPPPRVKSAVIRLKRNQRDTIDCDEKAFFRVVKTAFGQRRKTLRNSLKGMIAGRTEISEMDIFKLRPERLSVDDFVGLTRLLENK